MPFFSGSSKISDASCYVEACDGMRGDTYCAGSLGDKKCICKNGAKADTGPSNDKALHVCMGVGMGTRFAWKNTTATHGDLFTYFTEVECKNTPGALWYYNSCYCYPNTEWDVEKQRCKDKEGKLFILNHVL